MHASDRNDVESVAHGRHRLCVAPMMDWTDRFCRSFHRVLSPNAFLYTEMVTTGALLHGDSAKHLRFDPAEHPVGLQVGGSDPVALARCAELGEKQGFDEINLNCGCPSDRVQTGCFGAVLMKDAALVAECVRAMRGATSKPVTVKHRLGVDDLEGWDFIRRFIDTVAAAGCETFIVHARKAWLSGLSPKENREIPPLDHPTVHRLKRAYPQLRIIINGGIRVPEEIHNHLQYVDGVMIGREAYDNPWQLAAIEESLFADGRTPGDREEALERYLPFVEAELASGTPLARITRHILGLFKGQPGGRAFRRVLSERATRHGAGIEVLNAALREIERGTWSEAEAA